MKVKLIVEYVGSAFCGWQYQSNVRTVQGELSRALGIYLSSLARQASVSLSEFPILTASGRTDSGVHANGQVVSFVWPDSLKFNSYEFVNSLNGISDSSLNVVFAGITTDDFDARYTPHIKCYKYHILNRGTPSSLFSDYSWHIVHPLNVSAMINASKLFLGTHDFSSFRASDCCAKTSIRTLLLSELIRVDNNMLVYSICGKGFLKQMVRIIVGTLVDVGLNKITVDEVRNIMSACSRSLAGDTAPAKGLCLEWVRYI